MRSTTTPEELARRSAAILSVLAFEEWLRPIDIARLADLPFGVAKSALKHLLATGAVRKRSYEARVMRGAVRKRYTSKPLVEYQLICQSVWSVPWLPKAPAVIAGARQVRGRCGCSG